MAREIGRCFRRAAARQIVRARDEDAADAAEPPRHETRIRKGADAQPDIEVLLDQVDIAVVEEKLRREGRMGVEKARQDRRHVPPSEDEGRRDAHEAAQRSRARSAAQGLVVIGEDAARLLGETAAFVGRREAAGGALDEPHAEPFLEGREAAGHGRRRAVQAPRRSGEAAGVEDRRENGKLVEAVHRDRSEKWNAAFHLTRIPPAFDKA